MIIHVYSEHSPSDPDSMRRHRVAQSTWAAQGWQEFPIKDSNLPRLFLEGQKRLPFVTDLLDKGCTGQSEDTIVVFSNSDIGFASNACGLISGQLQDNNAGYAFRRDFPRLNAVPADSDIERGRYYCGIDVFFFRVRWWTDYRSEFPDMVFAREAWDACLQVLVELTNPVKPCSIPNLIFHERHGGTNYWEDPRFRYSLPGQIHNLQRASQKLSSWGYHPAQFGIR